MYVKQVEGAPTGPANEPPTGANAPGGNHGSPPNGGPQGNPPNGGRRASPGNQLIALTAVDTLESKSAGSGM